MSGTSVESIRNVAVVGHVGAGKTSLVEGLLHCTGAIGRAGRVDDGGTVSDSEPEEKAHGMSIFASVVQVEHDGHRLNLIDTPGYLDFEGSVRAALEVADLALFVISATDGVGVGAQSLWRLAAERGLPRMVFVNKLDAERTDFEATVAEIREHFGEAVSVLELPIGQGPGLHGVVDLEDDSAWEYDGDKVEHHDVPPEMADAEHAAHDSLVEQVVVGDDELLEHYLEGEEPTYEQLDATLAHEVADCTAFPVLCGSALTGVGVDRLAEMLCHLAPSPAAGPSQRVRVGEIDIEVPPDPDGEPAVFVFKTISDEYVGQISVGRVLSGTIRPGMHLLNSTTGANEHLHGLARLRGSQQEPVPEAVAGDIVAMPKLSGTHTGDTLTAKDNPVRHVPVDWPEPAIARAVSGQSPSDEDKLALALQRVCEEDPSLRVDRVDETHQTLLRGVGPTHLDVTLERMSRRFHVAFDTADELVAYRETITRPAEAEGRHKKQSGGHGQFGVAGIRVEPLPRGAGFEFADEVVGGAVPKQFIPAVEKGVREAMAEGGEHGVPVVDIRVTLLDGKAHSVDSSEMAFRQAGRLALRNALAEAGPVVLEPMSEVEIEVPSSSQGDVLGDLNSRRGRVQRTEPTADGNHLIVATVPTAEILTYVIDLRALTGGRGTYRASHAGYDVRPDRR